MRLLVVEDEPDLAAALRTGLAAEGYTVDVCADGPTGLAFALTGGYAAILLDLMLPGLSGYRIVERLRAAGDQTPVVVLTAKLGQYDHTDALDTGADDFLTKPFAFPILLARLRAVIRRSAGGRAAQVVTVGALQIDGAARTASRDGVALTLTALEFALLELLAARPSEPVSKDHILGALWPDEAVDPNLVEARIAALRRKVDLPFGGRSIETVRGAGYRLVDDRVRGG